ncbi:MAG: hypothetical protein HY940_10340 [Gammaproteobacteria bacterium]|nr:hypothetical protein [Gammaproteobacteria bacterium]
MNIKLQTKYFDIHGRHCLDKRRGIHWDLGRTRQDDAYTPTGARLGIRRAF